MSDFFVAGGFGMYPTLLAGLLLLGSCIQYSRQPERRYVPLMLALGMFTLLAGGLGFVTGVMAGLNYYANHQDGSQPVYLALGFGESLHNVVLALLLSVISTIFAAVGAWRFSRQLQPAAAR